MKVKYFFKIKSLISSLLQPIAAPSAAPLSHVYKTSIVQLFEESDKTTFKTDNGFNNSLIDKKVKILINNYM